MKKTILIAFMLVLGLGFAQAQTKDKDSMPKETTTIINLNKLCCNSSIPLIEKTLAYEKGVKSFEVSLEDKTVSVVYKTKSTSPDKIAKSLAKAGFEANGIEADEKAINRLPECCRNTARGLSSGCGHSH